MESIGIEWVKTYVLRPSLNTTTIRVGRYFPGHFVALIVYFANESNATLKNCYLNNPSEEILMDELRSWISNQFGEGYSLVEIQS